MNQNHHVAVNDDVILGNDLPLVLIAGPCQMESREHALECAEALKTIACFRFILPRQEIMVAGGRVVNLREAQSLMFMAGASALMVGNYLTTVNQPVEKDLQMLKDLGLDPRWDKHGFSDQVQQPAAAGTGAVTA